MSFLDNVKFNGSNIGAANNPFMAKPGKTPLTSAPNTFRPSVTNNPFAPSTKSPIKANENNTTKDIEKDNSNIEEQSTEENVKTITENKDVENAKTEEPVVEEAKESVVEEVNEPVAEEVEESVAEKSAEEVSSEKVVETTTDTDPKDTEGSIETKTEEKKSKKKRSRKKVQETKEEASEEPNVEEKEIVEKLFKNTCTNIGYAQAIGLVRNNFVDEEWEDFRKDVIQESDDITIESDMQEGAVKKTLAKLNALREKIWVAYMDTKVLLESLSSKDTEGLIERVKYSYAEGNNDYARKKSGIMAAMNYNTPQGEVLNLYELYDETKKRYAFLRGVFDTISYKSDILITMSTAIKLEKNNTNI